MANTNPANNKGENSGLEHMAEEVFSSEKREDIWAILIAVAILVLSLVFPEQIYHFFKDGLFFF